MARKARNLVDGYVYHILNRGNQKQRLFEKEQHYRGFLKLALKALQRYPVRLLSYCLMPNHWHFVVWPESTDTMSNFMRWLCTTHAQQWHWQNNSSGAGHVYQGRYKSFPIQQDQHFLSVCRYVERNALNSSLVNQAEDWRWSSLWLRRNLPDSANALLAKWPLQRPSDWLTFVNQPFNTDEKAALQTAMHRSFPFGGTHWEEETAQRHNIPWPPPKRGRPKLIRDCP